MKERECLVQFLWRPADLASRIHRVMKDLIEFIVLEFAVDGMPHSALVLKAEPFSAKLRNLAFVAGQHYISCPPGDCVVRHEPTYHFKLLVKVSNIELSPRVLRDDANAERQDTKQGQ